MSQGRGRGKASKGVVEFRPYVTRVIPVGANIVCADNTGAKILEIVNVHKYKTRVSRLLLKKDLQNYESKCTEL